MNTIVVHEGHNSRMKAIVAQEGHDSQCVPHDSRHFPHDLGDVPHTEVTAAAKTPAAVPGMYHR